VPRRNLIIAGAAVVVLIAAAAAAVAVALARDDGDRGPRRAGRIAVRNGCGLTHMWPDGTDPRPLCLTGIWDTVSLSFDGKTLAWDRIGEDAFEITLAAPDATGQRSVPLPKGANVAPTLSPDGDKIAFLHSPRDDGRYDVWTTSTTAPWDQSQQVTALHSVSSVSWSPKGDRLVYVANWSDETLEGDIFVARPNGDGATFLWQGDAPSWAPDGKRLVFVHGGDLWTSGIDGKDRRRLRRHGDTPAWSRDGALIAFMREERCGRPVCKDRVYVMFADGGQPHAVGPRFLGARQIIWLPDPHE
jgi:Tol biopolymer transport system component